MNDTNKVKWPSMDKDQKAWQLAKSTASPNEPLSSIILRAQRIKESL